MSKKLHTIQAIAKDKKWVSFLYDYQPYSLLHWSKAGIEEEEKDAWLLQDEMTFEMQEFATIEEAMNWIAENMKDVTDILA